MRSKFGDNEPQDVSYHGNAFLRLMGYIKPYWKTVALCCVLVGLLTVFDIARPRIIGDAIDKYITQQSAQDLPPETRFQGILIAAGLYVAILLLQFICNRLQYLKIQETGQNIVYTLRNELMAHVESLSMRFFDLTPVGRIVTRITNDTEAVNDLYANTIVRLFRNVVKIIGLAIIMMVMNFRMAMLSFVLVPVMAVLTAVFRKLSRKTYQIVKTRITTLNTFLSEHLSGMRVIQIFAREKEKCAEFEEKNESLYRAGVREMMVFAIFRYRNGDYSGRRQRAGAGRRDFHWYAVHIHGVHFPAVHARAGAGGAVHDAAKRHCFRRENLHPAGRKARAVRQGRREEAARGARQNRVRPRLVRI